MSCICVESTAWVPCTLPLAQPQLCTNPPGFRDGTLVKCVEFILSPFLNYGFIFISLVFSRGGVGKKGKGRRQGNRLPRFFSSFFSFFPLSPYFCFVSELPAPIKGEGFNGSCRHTNLIPMKLGFRRQVMNTMKTELEVRAFILSLMNPLGW